MKPYKKASSPKATLTTLGSLVGGAVSAMLLISCTSSQVENDVVQGRAGNQAAMIDAHMQNQNPEGSQQEQYFNTSELKKPEVTRLKYPIAKPVPHRPRFVYNPYVRNRIVDVKGIPSGTLVADIVDVYSKGYNDFQRKMDKLKTKWAMQEDMSILESIRLQNEYENEYKKRHPNWKISTTKYKFRVP